jgi:Zn-dependent peptidase ImmA (M78 family)
MPKSEMVALGASLGKDHTSDWTDAEINEAAQKIGASREAFVIRAVTLGLASRRFYATKRQVFEREYEKFDEPSGEPVPVPPYKQMLGRYGRPFARAVLNSYKERRITMNDAAAFLEVPAKRLDYIADLAVRRQ